MCGILFFFFALPFFHSFLFVIVLYVLVSHLGYCDCCYEFLVAKVGMDWYAPAPARGNGGWW